MLNYLWICLLPIIILLVAKWHYSGHRVNNIQQITWKEFGISLAAILAITGMVYASGSYYSLSDTAIINGEVTSKFKDRVHCRHSYPCRCRTVRSGKTTSTRCDTCYRHPFDNDWVVKSNVGQLRINTVDSQGLIEPPRWTGVVIGEPFAKTESYINYIKAAPNSLLHYSHQKLHAELVPDYPDHIFDYYRISRVIQIGTNVKLIQKYDEHISNALKKLGPQKQANIVLVFTNKGRMMAHTVRNKWVGAKKNDVLVIIGTKDNTTIDWVESFAWSTKPAVNNRIRDDLLELKSLENPAAVIDVIANDITKHYIRRPMSDFEYLKNEITPPLWVIILSIIASFGTTFGMIRFSTKNNI